MATTVNTISITNPNFLTDITDMTSTSVTTAGAQEVFRATVDARDGNYFIVVDNTNGSGAVSLKTVAGSYVGASTELCGNIADGGRAIAFVDSAKLKNGAVIEFALVPQSSKNLVGAMVAVVQYIPVTNH